jgi:hypothetical protein
MTLGPGGTGDGRRFDPFGGCCGSQRMRGGNPAAAAAALGADVGLRHRRTNGQRFHWGTALGFSGPFTLDPDIGRSPPPLPVLSTVPPTLAAAKERGTATLLVVSTALLPWPVKTSDCDAAVLLHTMWPCDWLPPAEGGASRSSVDASVSAAPRTLSPWAERNLALRRALAGALEAGGSDLRALSEHIAVWGEIPRPLAEAMFRVFIPEDAPGGSPEEGGGLDAHFRSIEGALGENAL